MRTIRAATRFVKNITNVARGIPAIILANILLTRRCTQNCLQCTIPRESSDTPFMSIEHFMLLVDRLNSHGTQFISLSGGEPLLHPNISECIRYAAGKRFFHLQLLTTLFAPNIMVEKTIETMMETGTGIQVSFDGFGDVADTLRGAKHVSDSVMRNMELVTGENKKRCKPVRTSANIVLSRMNLHQVPEIIHYLESIGWKVNVDIYRWSSNNQQELESLKIEDNREFRKVLTLIRNSPAVTTPHFIIDGFPAYLKGEAPKRCPYLDSKGFGTKIYINPEGSVSVCIGDKMGNLFEQTPAELFHSEEWENRIAEMRVCKGCWNSCYTPSAVVFHPTCFNDLKAIWEITKKG